MKKNYLFDKDSWDRMKTTKLTVITRSDKNILEIWDAIAVK